MSVRRKKWTRNDVRASQILRFARTYHGKNFRFLTLTTAPGQEEQALRERLKALMQYLRRFQARLEYWATRTGEGHCGVYHLVLISSAFIPNKRIQDFWGARTWIEREHDFEGLLLEMVLQRKTVRYSMSREFLPDGSLGAIEAIGRTFRGRVGGKAQAMLARRWGGPDAITRTVECCSRKDGWHCDLATRREILGGRG